MKKIFLTLLTAVSFFAATAQESKTMYVMKDNAILFEYVVSEIDSIIFYKPAGTTPVIPENGVLINGVLWATRNVDASGTFVDNPEDFGKLYQWDSNVSWTSTDPMISSNGDTEWDMNYLSGTTWEKFNDPSPAGWRVPTHEEHLTLLDTEKVSSEWFILNGVTGRKFTDIATGNSIFLPAVGFRVYGDYGALEDTGERGYYWSSTQNESNDYEAYTLGFNDEEYGAYFYDSGWRLDGFSVRPLAENTVVLPVVTSVSLSKETLILNIGDDHTLTATVLPENAIDKTVTWTSNDNTKAIVVDGKVTALAEGTVAITAKAGNVTATCTVTISTPIIAVTGISLDKTTLSLSVGENYTLTATVTPTNATDRAVTWTSSNNSIASVDNNGKVTAIAAGTVTITAKAGNETATCTVSCTSSSTGYSGGNGSEANPYLISSKANMEWLANRVNAGTNYSGSYFLLTRDLTGENDTITSIVGSNYSSRFSGIFDGDGYEIAIKLIASGEGNNSVGLFGIISNAKIKNLGVSGYITHNAGGGYVGSICGQMYQNNTISSCYSKVNIFSSTNQSEHNVGGICGFSGIGTNDNNLIINCYNTGNIRVENVGNSAHVGGIIARCNGSGSNVIANCYSTGEIFTTRGDNQNIAFYAGGICGYYGSVENCFTAMQGNGIINSMNTSIGRSLTGRIAQEQTQLTNNYAYDMTIVNGEAISSLDENGKHGKDTELEYFKNQSWLESILEWDFANVWKMSVSGFPILKMER